MLLWLFDQSGHRLCPVNLPMKSQCFSSSTILLFSKELSVEKANILFSNLHCSTRLSALQDENLLRFNYRSEQRCIVLYYIVLYCITLYRIALHCIALLVCILYFPLKLKLNCHASSSDSFTYLLVFTSIYLVFIDVITPFKVTCEVL